ncbi:nucleolin-like [Arachis ipaensis]|uniref:nucleolin-like n=1 Tax=Arachis ipaensis TaxID=130454 RepID=UPI0007AEEA9C|nr:nucleolin-like [Arachis ipaensis]
MTPVKGDTKDNVKSAYWEYFNNLKVEGLNLDLQTFNDDEDAEKIEDEVPEEEVFYCTLVNTPHDRVDDSGDNDDDDDDDTDDDDDDLDGDMEDVVTLGACTPIVKCGETTKELSEGVNLELQDEEEKLKQEVQQEEEVEIMEPKEVVEDLGDIECKEESHVEEPSSMEEEVEDTGEEEYQLEEAWQEVGLEALSQVVEASRREWTGVERALSRPLETPPHMLPSNPSFE